MTLQAYRFPIRLGGHAALDFSNTVEYRGTAGEIDFLHTYEHVIAWGWRAHLLEEAEAEQIAARAAQQPAEANAAFAAVIDLRAALYRIFAAVIDGAPPAAADLDLLNTLLAQARTEQRLAAGDSGFEWVWRSGADLRRVLWQIAGEAAALLTSDQLKRLRQCPNCGWLFLDTSRNHSRRWCSMDFCGSQVKSRRQYERRKQAKA